MFKRKDEKELNVGRLNELIRLSHSILKVLFVFLIVIGIYMVIRVLKEVKVLSFIFVILGLISPLFIGLVIAWLFDPIVTWLNKKGLKRGLGAALCYVGFLGILAIVIIALIPVLSEQTNELVTTTLPSLFEMAKNKINDIFSGINNEFFDANAMKLELFAKLEVFATNLTSSLPEIIVNLIKSLFSGLGTFAISLIIGFYLLLDFDKNADAFYLLIPNGLRDETKKLFTSINKPLKKFVNGALIDCSVIFVIMAIGFSIIGLKAPLLFALFCAITNVIPFAGPYIGGAPAVIVGFTQSPTMGFAILIFIFVVQMIEGNLLQPIIMSKATKLSPVTIILGLLVFGYFWGILGMVLSTPIIGVVKELINFFDEKYDFLNFRDED